MIRCSISTGDYCLCLCLGRCTGMRPRAWPMMSPWPRLTWPVAPTACTTSTSCRYTVFLHILYYPSRELGLPPLACYWWWFPELRRKTALDVGLCVTVGGVLLQVIWQKGKNMFVLFTRWGRIGDRGQWQHTPFPSPEEAVKEFGKVFRQKTGNDWNSLDKSVHVDRL